MRLDSILRAHAFMQVERPPELWEVDSEDVRFLPLLGEMIVVGLRHGVELAGLTLSAVNVVVEEAAASETGPAAGEYVAVTVSGPGSWGADATWRPRRGSGSPVLAALDERLTSAGARYAYLRNLISRGSLTIFPLRQAPAT